MRRVMIICNSLMGLISFRKELIESLVNDKNEVLVVAPSDDLSEVLIKMGCIFIPVEMESRGTNPLHDLKLINNLKKIIKNEKPNIVLTYTIKPNAYAGHICGKLKIPFIANVTGLGTSVEQPGILQKITLFLYKRGLKRASCVFFQNKANLDFMLSHKVVKGNYKLIPGSGVNLSYHTLLPYPEDNVIKFLFISRILFEKGIEEYLECAKYIKEKYPNTEFHILGKCDDDKYSNMLEELQKKNIVIYHGAVSDVREYHKISNCTIHPSFYPEGMSNVLLESCAAGRPIITTNRPGCKEIVEDGINGFMIECRDTDGLKQKVEKFINLSYEDKKQMGINGRKKVEKQFDRNIVIKAYMDLIKIY